MKATNHRTLPAYFMIGLVTCASLWFTGQNLQAQETEVAVAEEEPPKKTLIDQYKTGGWAMYPLTLFSIAGFGLIIYNAMAIRPELILNPEATNQIDKALEDLDIEKAQSICAESPSPTTNIVAAGLNRIDLNNYDQAPVKEAIEEASSEELAGPFILINYLSVIGSLAPMVGLLGTVSGMVKAFNVIEAEGAGSAQALAGNISEALITTASGMIVGIPAMFFFFFFKNRYGKITSRVARVVGDLEFTLGSAIKKR